MRYLFFLIAIILMTCSLPAQSYEITWGEEFRREGGLFSTWQLAGLTDSSYHVIMQPRRNNTLLSFNLDHSLRETQSIEFKFGREDLHLADFVKTRAGTFACLMSYDKRAREFSLLASPFSDGIFGDIKEVHQHEFRSNWAFVGPGATNYRNADLINSYTVSENRSKVGFANVLSSTDRRNEEALSLVVFDENFDVIWQKVETLDFRDKDLLITQSIVSNNGDLFYWLKILTNLMFLEMMKIETCLDFYIRFFGCLKKRMKFLILN